MANKSTKSKRPQRGADGLYHVQVYIGKYDDGTRFYKRFKDANWTNLQLEILTFKKEWNAGMHRESIPETKQPPKEMTLQDAVEKYIDTCRAMMAHNPESYSPATIASYESYRRSMSKYPPFKPLLDTPISQVTVAGIQDAINAAARPAPGIRKLSVKTIGNWYGLIKPAIDTYGPDIRLDKVKRAKKPSEAPLIFREKDTPEILKFARETDDEFFLYTLFITVLGLRQSESHALTWGDLSAEPMVAINNGEKTLYGSVNVNKACVRDEFGKYITKKTKTAAGDRYLSRPWSFFELVYSVKPRGRDDENIFVSKPNVLPKKWKRLKEAVGLPEKMVMYDLRHYHATVMDYLKASDEYITHDMGHTNIDITRKHYIEELDVKKQEINAKVYRHTDNLLALMG